MRVKIIYGAIIIVLLVSTAIIASLIIYSQIDTIVQSKNDVPIKKRIYSASDKCNSLIKMFEGYRKKAYKDGNRYSVGYGFNYINGKKIQSHTKINRNTSDAILKQYTSMIASKLTNGCLNGVELSQNKLDALVCLVYNVGYESFSNSELCKFIRHNKDEYNIRKEWLNWRKSNGKVLQGLIKRRNVEYDLYCGK